MSTILYSEVNSTISNMFFGSTSISIIFLGRIFFVVTTIFSLTLGCHSKVNHTTKREKIIDCDFKNVSNSYRLSHSWENDSTIHFLKKVSYILTLLNPILLLFHALITILGFFRT